MDRNNVNGRQTRPPRSHSILTLLLVLVSMNVVVQYSYTYGERWRSQHLHLEQSLWNVMLWHDCQWRIILNCICTVDGMRHVMSPLAKATATVLMIWFVILPYDTISTSSQSFWLESPNDYCARIESYHIDILSHRIISHWHRHHFYIPQSNLTLSFPTNTLSITTTTIHNQQDKN